MMYPQEVLFVVNKRWGKQDLWNSDYVTCPPFPTLVHTENIYGFFQYMDDAIYYAKNSEHSNLVVNVFSVWGYNYKEHIDLQTAVPYKGKTLWGWIDENGEERIFPYYPSISWQREDSIRDLSGLIFNDRLMKAIQLQ